MLKRICVLGGDTRSIELVNMFIQERIDCKGYYNNNKDESIKEYVRSAQAIVLPLNTSTYDLDWIKFEEICPFLEKGTIIFAGRPNSDLLVHAECHGLIVKCFLNDETFLIKNSFVTAEGAIASAILNSKDTLINSKCAIIGSGRIASALFHYLKPFTNKIAIVSRNIERLSFFEMQGCSVYQIKALKPALGNADYVFNTIPARIIDKKALEVMKANSLYIELASFPFGCDRADVPCHVRYIQESGIPGKISPIAAARAMMDFIIREMEGSGKWN